MGGNPCIKFHTKLLAKLTECWGLTAYICSIFPGIPCICVGLFHQKDCWHNVLGGLLMLVLAPVLLIGLIWSLIWGYQIWTISRMNAVSAAAHFAKLAAS